MNDLPPIIGPDPAELTDEELMAVGSRLVALAREVAGCPEDVDPTHGQVADLEPADRYLFRSLHTQFKILVAENDRRLRADDEVLLAEITALLEGG